MIERSTGRRSTSRTTAPARLPAGSPGRPGPRRAAAAGRVISRPGEDQVADRVESHQADRATVTERTDARPPRPRRRGLPGRSSRLRARSRATALVADKLGIRAGKPARLIILSRPYTAATAYSSGSGTAPDRRQ